MLTYNVVRISRRGAEGSALDEDGRFGCGEASMSGSEPYTSLSLWMDSLPGPVIPRPPLPGDRQVDVAIIGAGYTGLWTAYYLAKRDPGLRIAVLEAETAGFGASGRNGGWCSALFPVATPELARIHGRASALAMARAMEDTVDEVGRVAQTEGIDCHYRKGGSIIGARTPVQLARARAEVAKHHAVGVTAEDLALLDARDAAEHAQMSGLLGGTYTPHCAALQPAVLVRGLAQAVERLGVTIFEQTRVLDGRGGLVTTDRGAVRADVVVQATEGYTRSLAGQRRRLAPVYSLMLATAPLPASAWERIGLARRQTFSDYRNMVIYGQRTADDRLAFGGRGAPYHFGSRIRPEFEKVPAVHSGLSAVLEDMFPGVEFPITHTWGGALGVPRDWTASVGYDKHAKAAWAGGYVGDGVGTANLAGRTLADLIVGVDTERTVLPWVGHRSRRWEPEPLRWLGINAGRRLAQAADKSEDRTGRESTSGKVLRKLLG